MNIYVTKRLNYAVHHLETQSSNEKAKDDILKRMEMDRMEVIRTISEEEFDRKNRVALMNDNFNRMQ